MKACAAAGTIVARLVFHQLDHRLPITTASATGPRPGRGGVADAEAHAHRHLHVLADARQHGSTAPVSRCRRRSRP
jgi:hypothetical protein